MGAAALAALLSRELSPEDYELLRALDETVERPHCTPATLARVLRIADASEVADAEATCAICLDALGDGGALAKVVRCAHVLHTECIRAHLGGAVTCPLDNLNVTEI